MARPPTASLKPLPAAARWPGRPRPRGLAGRLLERLNPNLAREVLGSGLAGSVDSYAAAALAAVLALAALAAVAGGLYAWRAAGSVPVAVAAAVLAAVSGLSLGLAAAVQLPRSLYRSRGAVLEPRFPLFAASLSARLAAGATLSSAIIAMYEEELGELREFRVELEYLASSLRAGMDLKAALEAAAWLTPSQSLRSLFTALSTASWAGTGLVDVIDALIREYLFSVEGQVDRVVNGLGALLEMFVTASVMLPVVLGVVGLLLVFQPLPGLSFESIAFLSTFILTPIVAAAVIVLSESTVSRVRV